MKPTFLLLSLLLAASDAQALESSVVVQPPNPPMPEDSCQKVLRLSVEPSEGGFVLATYREYLGAKAIGSDVTESRKIVRLIRCPDGPYSEDISYRSDDPARRHFVVSGFGQEVDVCGLSIPTESGHAAKGGLEGSTTIAAVTRRFIFSDSKEKSAARTFEYSLRAINADEARRMALGSAITIPAETDAFWCATLPQVKE